MQFRANFSCFVLLASLNFTPIVTGFVIYNDLKHAVYMTHVGTGYESAPNMHGTVQPGVPWACHWKSDGCNNIGRHGSYSQDGKITMTIKHCLGPNDENVKTFSACSGCAIVVKPNPAHKTPAVELKAWAYKVGEKLLFTDYCG